MLLNRRTVKHNVALLRRELVKRHVGTHTHLACHLLHQIPHERAPRKHRAFVDSLGLVGHQARLVHLAHDTGAAAGGTRAAAVKGKVLGTRRVELTAALGARERQARGHVKARLHARPAVRTHVMGATAKEQTQAIVELGHGTKGRAHTRHAGALMQCERRRYVQHLVHLGMFGLRQTAAGIGAKRLQVATRALGVKNAQCQRTLARTRYASNTHELSQRNIDIDVLEVVHTRATYLYSLRAHLLFRHLYHPTHAIKRGRGCTRPAWAR